MKTLDEFNRSRHALYGQGQCPLHNGIACPKCGSELYDSQPNVTLTSNPPQKNVHCQCGYVGYRVA